MKRLRPDGRLVLAEFEGGRAVTVLPVDHLYWNEAAARLRRRLGVAPSSAIP